MLCVCDTQVYILVCVLCSTPTIATISIALLCQHFYTDISHETMELLHLILQTLIELCVGNYLNQKVIYNRQIMDVLNAVLQHDIRDCVKQTDDHIQNVNLSIYVFLSACMAGQILYPCNPQLFKETFYCLITFVCGVSPCIHAGSGSEGLCSGASGGYDRENQPL